MFWGLFGTPLAVYVWQNLVGPKFQKQNRRDSFEGTLGEGRSKKSALSTHVLGLHDAGVVVDVADEIAATAKDDVEIYIRDNLLTRDQSTPGSKRHGFSVDKFCAAVNTLTDDSREGVVAGAKAGTDAGTDAAETPHVSMPSQAATATATATSLRGGGVEGVDV
jgi:hypothetical protein